MKTYDDLPKWFRNQIETVLRHNDYAKECGITDPSQATATECAKHDRWSPCDLILREEYNNGGGSARGFLGLTPSQCHNGYRFIKEHQEELKAMDMYNKDGRNNFGFSLWHDYKLH